LASASFASSAVALRATEKRNKAGHYVRTQAWTPARMSFLPVRG
jgi:hypothetical protein